MNPPPNSSWPQRIAQRVDDAARGQARRRDLPQFLDAERELRRLAVPRQRQAAQQLLGQVAADAVAKHRHLRPDVHTGFEAGLRRPLAVQPPVARSHADDASAFEQHLLAGKAGEQVHAGPLDALGHPLHQLVQRHQQVAVIDERRRNDRKAECSAFSQEVDTIVRDRRRDRRTLRLEVGNQLAERRRIQNRARQDMRASLACLLEHRDRERAAVGGGALCQPERACQAGRAAADDEDVDFEGFSRSAHVGIRFHKSRSRNCSSGWLCEFACELCIHRFFNSAMSAGTTSNRSPTMP